MKVIKKQDRVSDDMAPTKAASYRVEFDCECGRTGIRVENDVVSARTRHDRKRHTASVTVERMIDRLCAEWSPATLLRYRQKFDEALTQRGVRIDSRVS